MDNLSVEQKDQLKRKLAVNAEVLKTMAHPVRLCILTKLCVDGRCNVGSLQGCLDVAQPTISQHLAKLKAANIVESERSGNEIFYEVTKPFVQSIVETILKS
jgi:ArsR family transcriptional regulator